MSMSMSKYKYHGNTVLYNGTWIYKEILIEKQAEEIKELKEENARLKEKIEKLKPRHPHYHDDCVLCQWDKERQGE